jgi:putative flavoprotein involved in K+ transport
MTSQPQPLRTGTLVIGAGQAGLSAAYHLATRDLPFLIVDSDERVGDHWRRHWASLRLYSPAAVDGLPGMPFPAKADHYPSGRDMGDYLEAYARRFDVPVISGTRIERVRRTDDGGFEATAPGVRFVADQVIVATGAFRQPRIPDVAGRLDPSIRQLHSSEYRDPSQLLDGPVLVVGLSHSGADIAFEVARGHRTYLSGKAVGEFPLKVTDTRRAVVGWFVVRLLATRLFTLGTPIGRRMAPHVRNGGGPLLRVRSADLRDAGVIRYDEKTTGVSGGKPMLDDGRVLDVANVIWATGFRPDYDCVDVPGFVGEDRWPVGARGISPAAPGLYFLGVPFQWAFASMNVFGVGRDAKFVVDRVAERATVAARSSRAVGTATA